MSEVRRARDKEECEGEEKCKREPQSGREGDSKDGKDVAENEFGKDPLNGDLQQNRLCLSDPPP